MEPGRIREKKEDHKEEEKWAYSPLGEQRPDPFFGKESSKRKKGDKEMITKNRSWNTRRGKKKPNYFPLL